MRECEPEGGGESRRCGAREEEDRRISGLRLEISKSY